jgi:ribonuclease Z
MLALTHFSTRYPVALLRDEARAVFEQTVLPRDFDTIDVPLPERGGPRLVRWNETAQPEAAAT